MKKLVSLFLACLMVLSIGMIPAFATSETELFPGKEEALEVGDLTGTPVSTGGFGGTNLTTFTEVVAAEVEDSIGVAVKKDDAGNVYFELDAYNKRADGYHSHKLFIDDYDSSGKGTNSTKVKKYSALVSLPSVEQGTTNVFGQAAWNTGDSTTGFNIKAIKGFGVQLKNGGAYYYDPEAVVDEETKGAYINFVPNGTMQADKYYRIVAIKDFRGRKTTSEAGPIYMRAFVYDGENLLGETGWVYTYKESYKYDLDGRSTCIDAYGYPEKTVVKIDEFKAYKLDNIPTLEVASGSSAAIINKYVAAKTSNAWRRTVGERFNLSTTTKNNPLGEGSVNTAARYNLSFRIPKFGSEFYLIDFIGTRNMLNSNTQALEGVAMVDKTGAFGAKAVDGSAVTLTEGTSYQLAENTWYTLEALVDYSVFDEPKATITLKDAAGNVLTKSAQAYTISKIPNTATSPTWCQANIMWVGFSDLNSYIHFDNTAAYIAPTYADILADTNITIMIEDDFETYLGPDAQYYVEGYNYAELVGLDPIMPDLTVDPEGKPTPASLQDAIHVYHTDPDGKVGNIDNAVIAADRSAEGIDFENGMTLPATKAMTLNFAFSNDISNDNINYNTVIVYANDVELIPSMDYDLVLANDGEIPGSSKNMKISFKAAAANTTYKIRLSAGVSDYNMSVTSASDSVIMGLPTSAGLYQDITFTTPDDVNETSIVSKVVNADGAAIDAVSKATAVCGKVDIVNANSTSISGCVAIAVYDNGKLVDLKVSDGFSVAPNMVSSDETEAIAITKAGLTAKVFVWDRLDSLLPIALEYALTK
ncbi:MAG: hypothetical protein IKW59_05030 [Clostridia bacterium]|nr:hypothetical protein [Clostridia bacterium]